MRKENCKVAKEAFLPSGIIEGMGWGAKGKKRDRAPTVRTGTRSTYARRGPSCLPHHPCLALPPEAYCSSTPRHSGQDILPLTPKEDPLFNCNNYPANKFKLYLHSHTHLHESLHRGTCMFVNVESKSCNQQAHACMLRFRGSIKDGCFGFIILRYIWMGTVLAQD